MRNGALRHEKIRSEVEIERLIPALGGDVLDALLPHHPRRVDEDVEAPERAGRLVGKGARGGGVAQVRLHELRPTTRRPNPLAGLPPPAPPPPPAGWRGMWGPRGARAAWSAGARAGAASRRPACRSPARRPAARIRSPVSPAPAAEPR